MSELKARNSSSLKGFVSSSLKAFGGGKIVEDELAYVISITWEVTFILIEWVAPQTVISITPGAVTQHGNYFVYQTMCLGSSNHRGKVEQNVYNTQPYNGSIDPINDNVSDFTPIAGTGSTNFAWYGWQDHTSKPGGSTLPSKPLVIDTGSSIEMYAEIRSLTADYLAGSKSADGCFLYGPWIGLTYDGFNWVRRARELDAIMLYLTGMTGISAISAPGTSRQVNARIKATISV